MREQGVPTGSQIGTRTAVACLLATVFLRPIPLPPPLHPLLLATDEEERSENWRRGEKRSSRGADFSTGDTIKATPML